MSLVYISEFKYCTHITLSHKRCDKRIEKRGEKFCPFHSKKEVVEKKEIKKVLDFFNLEFILETLSPFLKFSEIVKLSRVNKFLYETLKDKIYFISDYSFSYSDCIHLSSLKGKNRSKKYLSLRYSLEKGDSFFKKEKPFDEIKCALYSIQKHKGVENLLYYSKRRLKEK